MSLAPWWLRVWMCQDRRAVFICSGVGGPQVIKWCALFGPSVNVCVCVCVCFPTVQVFNTLQFWVCPEPAASGSRQQPTLQQQLTLCCQALWGELAKAGLLCPLEDNYDSADGSHIVKQQLATQSKQTSTGSQRPLVVKNSTTFKQNWLHCNSCNCYKVVMLFRSTCSAAAKFVSAWQKLVTSLPSLPATAQPSTTSENCLFHPLTALIYKVWYGEKKVKMCDCLKLFWQNANSGMHAHLSLCPAHRLMSEFSFLVSEMRWWWPVDKSANQCGFNNSTSVEGRRAARKRESRLNMGKQGLPPRSWNLHLDFTLQLLCEATHHQITQRK